MDADNGGMATEDRYARGWVLAADAAAAEAVRAAADGLGWDSAVEPLSDPPPDRPAAPEGQRFADPLRVRLSERPGSREPDAGDIVRVLAGRADVWLDDGRAPES